VNEDLKQKQGRARFAGRHFLMDKRKKGRTLWGKASFNREGLPSVAGSVFS